MTHIFKHDPDRLAEETENHVRENLGSPKKQLLALRVLIGQLRKQLRMIEDQLAALERHYSRKRKPVVMKVAVRHRERGSSLTRCGVE